MRDRERGNEPQSNTTPTSTQRIPPQHILSRPGIGTGTILEKDRTEFRDRSSMNEERFQRRSFNRDFGMGMEKERNIRGVGGNSSSSSRNDHHHHNSSNSNNSRFGGSSMNSSHYNSNNQNNHYHHRRGYNDRSYQQEEPEWFSGGPTS